MRIPIFVFTLIVICGVCGIYAEESVHPGLVKEELNNENRLLSFSNVPLEKSLSRNKRSVLSPITNILLRLISLSNNVAVRTALRLSKFVLGALTGQAVCPKEVKLSLNLIEKILLEPTEAIQTLICYCIRVIGSQSDKLIGKLLKATSLMIRKVILPGMHTTLNAMDNTGMLPPSMKPMIVAFNTFYGICKMLKYVS